ncbi:hypothetical protein DFR71_2187 [Nocardia alba]|uniref:Uncharacterized protein n=1 Tax=Nocardia alba TaxID=225051 RepID=A0A4R1G3X1_9NOCA|nr:hypothetical protein DFR71_2187 [Nocardia alba]
MSTAVVAARPGAAGLGVLTSDNISGRRKWIYRWPTALTRGSGNSASAIASSRSRVLRRTARSYPGTHELSEALHISEFAVRVYSEASACTSRAKCGTSTPTVNNPADFNAWYPPITSLARCNPNSCNAAAAKLDVYPSEQKMIHSTS